MKYRPIVAAVFGLGSVALATAACTATTSLPYPDVATFCSAKAHAECQIAGTCGIDQDGCEAQRSSLCNLDAMRATSSGTRKYTQTNAQACIDKINGIYGGAKSIPFSELFGPSSIDDVCERVFSGNAGTNDPCQSTYDCTGSNVCAAVFPGQAEMVCAATVPKNEGDFCQDPGSTCMTDTYCTMPSTGGGGYQCEPELQQGQPCDPVSAPCVSTERCEPRTGATGQTCEARVGADEPCTTNDDCLPSAPYCDPYVGNICTTGLSFATHAPDCAAYESGSPVVASTGDAGGPG
jgi:hypothetical protein